jgi:hypothetical protein
MHSHNRQELEIAGMREDLLMVAEKSMTAEQREKLKARLIELAAQMAMRQGMPSPDEWPGWGGGTPQKLWRAARDECDKASNQCADWAYEIGKIARAL